MRYTFRQTKRRPGIDRVEGGFAEKEAYFGRMAGCEGARLWSAWSRSGKFRFRSKCNIDFDEKQRWLTHTHTYPEKFQSVLSFSVYLCDAVTPTRGCELIAFKFPARNEENFRACFLFWHLSLFSPRIFSIFVARFCLRIFKILYHRVFVFLPPLINSLPRFVHPSSVFFCFCWYCVPVPEICFGSCCCCCYCYLLPMRFS